MKTILSIVILDNLHTLDYKEPLLFETDGEIEEYVKILKQLRDNPDFYDPTTVLKGYPIDKGYITEPATDTKIYDICQKLQTQNYYVRCQCLKYYVFAMALNFTRFEVFSKGTDIEVLTWRDNDENDPIIYQITKKLDDSLVKFAGKL